MCGIFDLLLVCERCAILYSMFCLFVNFTYGVFIRFMKTGIKEMVQVVESKHNQ
jgi:uncharacterized protein YjaG (DUF416 family)